MNVHQSEASTLHLTKILATLGPASSSLEMVGKLARAGADVFRLNFSHGTHEAHQQTLANIRQVEKDLDRPIGVVADLQGPKLRVDNVPPDGIAIAEGDELLLHVGEHDGGMSCTLPHPEIFAAAQAGDRLLLDDGKLALRIKELDERRMVTQVELGGVLMPRKGVNCPGMTLPIAALTEKDKADLAFALDIGVDWVAMSFVQQEADLIEAKELINGRARLIAKIEKPQAVANFTDLLRHSDGVMIARGDLGVETPLEQIPALQKRLVKQCRAAGKPVIVATQMLESMTHHATPTRAEASDVATALYDGTDAVMLSAESASGDYPVEAVEYMRRIIISTEADPEHQVAMQREAMKLETKSSAAIVAAACRVAEVAKAVAIVAFSKTGNTTIRASRQRPVCPLLGLTPLETTARATTLFWGVRSIVTSDLTTSTEMVGKASAQAVKYGYARDGDSIIVTAGVPLGVPGRTNVLRLAVIGEEQ